jgi:hypothetical protein
MRRIMAVATASVLGTMLAGCGVYREATASRLDPNASWRGVVNSADRDRLRKWRDAWDDGLAAAKSNDGGAIAADPALFDPDRALDNAMPPAGEYRCRTIKMGAVGTAAHAFIAYPVGSCTIGNAGDAGEARSFARLDGRQRPHGMLYKDSDARSVFVGTMVLGDEAAALRYDMDARRDMIGYVERIADRRWRLVLPRPRFESMIDVVELTPAG